MYERFREVDSKLRFAVIYLILGTLTLIKMCLYFITVLGEISTPYYYLVVKDKDNRPKL